MNTNNKTQTTESGLIVNGNPKMKIVDMPMMTMPTVGQIATVLGNKLDEKVIAPMQLTAEEIAMNVRAAGKAMSQDGRGRGVAAGAAKLGAGVVAVAAMAGCTSTEEEVKPAPIDTRGVVREIPQAEGSENTALTVMGYRGANNRFIPTSVAFDLTKDTPNNTLVMNKMRYWLNQKFPDELPRDASIQEYNDFFAAHPEHKLLLRYGVVTPIQGSTLPPKFKYLTVSKFQDIIQVSQDLDKLILQDPDFAPYISTEKVTVNGEERSILQLGTGNDVIIDGIVSSPTKGEFGLYATKINEPSQFITQ